MKPFLGIDLTQDKSNTQLNGDCFIAAKPSLALTQALEASMEKADATENKTKLPLALRIIQYACGIVAVLLFGGVLRSLSEVSLTEAYGNASVLFWIMGGCFVVWLALWLAAKLKERSVLQTEETAHLESNLESISKSIYTELRVPEEARFVDVLSFLYKEKNGEIKVAEKGMQFSRYFNPEFKIFLEGDRLCLVNLEAKYAFPLSSLRAIRTVNKGIQIPTWNKNEAHNKGRYAKYKMSVDNYGCLHTKPYYILELEYEGESWGIWLPCYELPVFEAHTGLKAQ